jgi:transketolase
MPTLEFVPAEEFARVWRAPGVSAADRAEIFADMARVNTLYSIMRAGSGHIGSSFSSLDIVTWIYLVELGALDGAELRGTYFSSKGHDVPGLYAVLTATGLLDFELLHRLRRLGGLPGHPDVHTPGMVTNTGSLGMGISKAKGMLEADRLDGISRPMFVLTGDGELQEGQNWEALVGAVNRRLSNLTVVVDHNKIQSDTWVRRVSDLGDLERKFAAFGWVVRRVDGHDLTAFGAALGELAADERPGVVIADTVKGRGVSFMEEFGQDEELYRFHSGAPSPDVYERAKAELNQRIEKRVANCALGAIETRAVDVDTRVPPVGGRLVDAYGDWLCRLARRDERVVALDGDLLLDTGLIPFVHEFPDRFIECGIAEQDMVSQAAGLALRDRLPFVHSFASFLSGRPHEQVLVNATESTRIVYVGSLAGIVPGGPGHSHQAVTDVASFSAAHGMLVVEPAHVEQIDGLLDLCLREHDGPVYVRLTTPPVELPAWPADVAPAIGVGTVLRTGGDVTIVVAGPVVLREALHAAARLEPDGVQAGVVSMPWHNRVDRSWWIDVLAAAPALVLVENHRPVGAMGQFLLARTAELGWSGRCVQCAIDDIPACGTNEEVLAAHGLDAASLAERIRAVSQASA